MNTSERSIYRDLLDHCYDAGSIPEDRGMLAIMAAVSIEEFEKAWPKVSGKFEPHPEQSARLINPRVMAELAKRAENSRNGREGGVKSGLKRRKKPAVSIPDEAAA